MSRAFFPVFCFALIICAAITLYSMFHQQQVNKDLRRDLLASVKTIRDQYAAEGKYDDIIVDGKQFLGEHWQCPEDDRSCLGPYGMTLRFNRSKIDGSPIYDAFILSFTQVPKSTCIALSETDWQNTITVNINTDSYTGNNVPVSLKDAKFSCRKNDDNTLVIVLQ